LSTDNKPVKKKRRKTILKTIRISQELDELLQKDAQLQRSTVNALISSIFTKYSEWDRYEEKFGYVSVTRQLFRALLEAAGEEKIASSPKS